MPGHQEQCQLLDFAEFHTPLVATPMRTFEELVREMIWDDLAAAQRDELCGAQGFPVLERRE